MLMVCPYFCAKNRLILNISPLENFDIDLTHHIRLRCVEFHFTEPENFSRDMSFATSTLSRIGSRQIEQVDFRFTEPSWKDGDLPTGNAQWVDVDAILASPQFATIKGFRIFAPPIIFAILSVVHPNLLPRCHARGIISFHRLSS
jgi:hypothetical protein